MITDISFGLKLKGLRGGCAAPVFAVFISVAGRSSGIFRKHSFHKHLLPDMHGRSMPSARRMGRQQTVTKMSGREDRSPAKRSHGNRNTHFNHSLRGYKQEPTPEQPITHQDPQNDQAWKATLIPTTGPGRPKSHLPSLKGVSQHPHHPLPSSL